MTENMILPDAERRLREIAPNTAESYVELAEEYRALIGMGITEENALYIVEKRRSADVLIALKYLELATVDEVNKWAAALVAAVQREGSVVNVLGDSGRDFYRGKHIVRSRKPR